MKTIAVIPTVNTLGLVAPLAEQLLTGDEVDELWLYDSGQDRTREWAEHRSKIDTRLRWFDASGQGIYDLWNRAILYNSDQETNVAILNSDIRLPISAVKDMCSLMRGGGYQLATIDPWRPAWYSQHHQKWNHSLHEITFPIAPHAIDSPPEYVVGWAFVVAAEFWANEPFAIYPGFQWWYGDDDLFRRTVLRGGRICRCVGIGSDHIGSASDHSNIDKQKKIEADAELFSAVWSR